MQTDILDFYEFYRKPLGVIVRDMIAQGVSDAWGDGAGLTIAGYGYANPYLEVFGSARARLAFAPGAQGVVRWPDGGLNCACLMSGRAWPLPDASLDRVLIVHGLEEAPDPQRLMREVWRVLADDGRIIVIAAHRRGLWSMIDSTPFAAGRPFLKRQLNALLKTSIFRAERWRSALFFPPFNSRAVNAAARSWERAGAHLWPGFGGVLMVEATKDMAAPVGLVRGVSRAPRPALAAPQPMRRDLGN